MNKPVRIDSSNKIDYNIEMYIKPEFVYVPLENKNGTTYKYLVKEGDYVYKGMIVAINKDNNLDDDTKDKRVFATLEDYSIVVDDCDIIKRDLINIDNVDNINIKLIEEL